MPHINHQMRIALEYPAIRVRLFAYLSVLADEQYQEREWGKQSSYNLSAEGIFESILNDFNLDSQEDAMDNVGSFLCCEDEVTCLLSLVDKMTTISGELKESSENRAYTSNGQWSELVTLANACLILLRKNLNEEETAEQTMQKSK